MQNWNECDGLGNKIAYLVDARDNKIYSVAKLKDGRCWMTRNLAIGSNKKTVKLTSEDSDVADDFELPVGSTQTTEALDDSAIGWNHYQFHVKNIWISEGEENSQEYGGYYNWFTATAGEGTKDIESGDVEHSICPKGWKLPNRTEIKTLADKYSGVELANTSFNVVFAGGCDEGGCPISNRSFSRFISSTANSGTSIDSLLLEGDGTLSLSSHMKGRGRSVRCIARK